MSKYDHGGKNDTPIDSGNADPTQGRDTGDSRSVGQQRNRVGQGANPVAQSAASPKTGSADSITDADVRAAVAALASERSYVKARDVATELGVPSTASTHTIIGQALARLDAVERWSSTDGNGGSTWEVVDEVADPEIRTDGGVNEVCIDADLARDAARELDHLIERSGGEDAGVDECNTPLAEVRQQVLEESELDEWTRGWVIGTIDKIAEERNVDVSGADPLTDRVFQARNALQDALESPEIRTDGGAKGHDYNTKTVRLHEVDRGMYVYLMLTKFNGEGALLGREGWQGEYIWYSVLVRRSLVAGADPFDLCRRHPADWFDDSVAAKLMKDLDMERTDFEDLHDGQRLSPSDVDRLAGRDSDDKPEAMTDGGDEPYRCANPDCNHVFGYDPRFEDPSEGKGHVKVAWNPEEEPSFVVEMSRRYCSVDCLTADGENHPFAGGDE